MSGYSRRTSAISHSQNGTGFVCGLSTRKTRTPAAHQCEHDVAQRLPEPLAVVGVPVDVVDVLVALGGFSANLREPSGRRWNHSGCSASQGWSGEHLDREVERDLEPVLARGRDERLEVGLRAELGMHRVVPARPRAPIAHGLPGSPGGALARCCAPLRLVSPIGWIGGR